MFQERKGKQWTYLSDMNGNKTLIDYILINRKGKHSQKFTKLRYIKPSVAASVTIGY